jgi:hypothetical protein
VWHISVGPWFIVDACCESIVLGIYCHMLNSNQLVQLRGCLGYGQVNVQAGFWHIGSNKSDLKYGTHMKPMYYSIILVFRQFK